MTPRETKDEEVFVLCRLGACEFLLAVAEVQEVSETVEIKQYPVALKGHLGVANLRGHVVPVISIAKLTGDAKAERPGIDGKEKSKFRLVLVSSPRGPFAILMSHVKKVSAVRDDSRDMINVEGRPVQIMSAAELAALAGEAA